MKTNRLCIILPAFALLAVLPLSGCEKKDAPADDAEAAGRILPIRVIPAESRMFESRLTVQGSLEAKNYANVAARTEGTLDEIWVDEGDMVEAGKTELFQIDPSRVQNALTIAKQNLLVAQASLAVAEASAEKVRAEAKKAELDFARYERLHQDGRVTENEFESFQVANEQAKAGIAVAEAQVDLSKRHVKSAEASVSIAQENFNDSKLVAPLSGAISSRSAEPGEHINSGRIILRIDDLSVVDAAAFIPAQYYPEITPGVTRFHLKINGQDAGMFPVTYRSPIISTTLRTFEIKGRVDAENGLAVPGSMADLTIVFESHENLGVPSSSILYRGGVPTVFVVEDGKAATRQVKEGLQNDGWTEILSGLKAGERVVTEGQTQLRDGNDVNILE
ncbi:MAG: efflux RND transporter periplasmic adaptor subunit [Verrucomicrobiota bacterium]|jgi:multidrug efflux pump subunit AcrA (membrane-fusion protein)|nr:efflux RND transporter periplasmic adaptor subunit [Verrucomicrobiota bacterium]